MPTNRSEILSCVERLLARAEPPPLVPRRSWDAGLDDAIERASPTTPKTAR